MQTSCCYACYLFLVCELLNEKKLKEMPEMKQSKELKGRNLKQKLSQAAACDGTRISTTAVGQDVAPGTLPIY